MRRLDLKLLRNTHLERWMTQRVRQRHSVQKKITEDLFAAQYCMNLVEKNDYENYLCTLLLSGEKRRHAFALRAFNVEVANCVVNVSNENITKLKLKFWYDSVDKCYDDDRSYIADHPVLRELKHTVETTKLSKMYLKRLVTVRDRPPNQAFVTIRQLEDYADHAFSSIFYLLVQMTGTKDLQVDHAVSHLGKAQGIATLLRAIPYVGRNQTLSVPQELLVKHGVSQERIWRSDINDKGVEECIFEVASVANGHLEKAHSLMQSVPKKLRSVLLPAVAVKRYLERLRKANFRLSHQTCLQRDSLLPMALYWHNLLNRY